MRKLIALAVVATIISTSCSKKAETQPDPTSTLTPTTTTTKKSRIFWANPATWSYIKELDHICLPLGNMNCMRIIVIKPSLVVPITQLNEAIGSGKDAIRNFFNTQNGLALAEIFNTDNVIKLGSGEYTMILRVSEERNEHIYLIGNYANLDESNPVLVVPTTRE